ncbi:hypothetical protein Hdeb2414_s0007g00236871 [Helianthus debilis subsp. tardiflorus]
MASFWFSRVRGERIKATERGSLNRRETSHHLRSATTLMSSLSCPLRNVDPFNFDSGEPSIGIHAGCLSSESSLTDNMYKLTRILGLT